jgi:competence protein ComEA
VVKPAGKVNINTADEAALTSLKGIGSVKATAILEYRQKNGPFKTVDDLAKVKGIGDKTVSKLRDQLSVE